MKLIFACVVVLCCVWEVTSASTSTAQPASLTSLTTKATVSVPGSISSATVASSATGASSTPGATGSTAKPPDNGVGRMGVDSLTWILTLAVPAIFWKFT